MKAPRAQTNYNVSLRFLSLFGGITSSRDKARTTRNQQTTTRQGRQNNMMEPEDSGLIRTALTSMISVVTTLQQNGQTGIAQALKDLTERVAGCSGFRQTRQEIIETLVFVGQQAILPPQERRHTLVKAALYYAKYSIATLGTLPEAWHIDGRTIQDFFNPE